MNEEMYSELPEFIEWGCCPGKSCGNVTLIKSPVVDMWGGLLVTYVRLSNGESAPYWDAKTYSEAKALLAEPKLNEIRS